MPSFDFPEIQNLLGDELSALVKEIADNPELRCSMIRAMDKDFPAQLHPMGDVSTRKDQATTSPTSIPFCGYEFGVTSIKITIPGEPVPKGRHRARIVHPRQKAPFIHFYQDADTEAYERRVALEASLVMRGRGLLLGALKIDVVTHVSIPSSWSEKKKLACQDTALLPASVLPTGRPDADNYLKCCLDAMNGVVYKDDAQVVKMSVEKKYSDRPRLEIEIFAVSPPGRW